MQAVAKKFQSSKKNNRETPSETPSSSTKEDLRAVTNPESNFTVKDLRNNVPSDTYPIKSTPAKSNSMNTSTSHTASTAGTSLSSSASSAKVEQKQKIAEAKTVSARDQENSRKPTSSTTSTDNRQSATSADRRQSTSTQKSDGTSVQLAKKGFPQEIEVPPGQDRRNSTKTELTDEGSRESSGAQQQLAEHVVREQYGLAELPTEDKGKSPEEVERRYASALCFAIGRAFTENQKEWIIGDLASKNYSQAVLGEIPNLLKASADLMDLEVAMESKKLITGDLRDDSRMLIYDMYRCSALEDFPEDQLCAIAMIAEEIGDFKFGELEDLKKQVELEEQVQRNRIKLLHPKGHEKLDDRFEDVIEDQNEENNTPVSKKTTNGQNDCSSSKQTVTGVKKTSEIRYP